MPNTVKQSQKRFIGGISDYLKENKFEDAFFFARAINYRNDPQSVTLMPGALKESGSVVTDLLKWGETIPTLTRYFFYGNTGNIYQRTSAAAWSNLHTTVSSHGNGLGYFTGDDYLYYTGDSALGRYGPVSGSSPQFSDNFLQAQGGVPTNTASVSFVSASSQYLHRADTASLSITGNLTLEMYFKFTTLPAVGSSMTLIGKWDESGATKSYIMDIYGISGYFGDGSGGALTIASDTVQAPTDSACSGTSATQTLSATNASFAVGQVIYIIQMQGTNSGQWERNTINGYTAGTITLSTPLLGSYSSSGSNKAQVIVAPQYTSVTVNSGKTWSAKPWNGTTGGILVYLCNGTTTVTGSISANSCGFRGGAGATAFNSIGVQGESVLGTGAALTTNNGSGGGAGQGQSNNAAGGGGGGGHATAGANGTFAAPDGNFGSGGSASTDSADLTTAWLGAGGGGGGFGDAVGIPTPGNGGNGGGWVFAVTVGLTVNGTVTATGQAGTVADGDHGSGGGGAGGSIKFKVQTATLGTGLVTAAGGVGGIGGGVAAGGDGGTGRISIDYLTSYTGTTTPTLNANQDSSLVTNVSYQMRLGISDDGSSSEYLTKTVPNLATGSWNRFSISWLAASSLATFYVNAVSLGTSTGTKTSISDNASELYVGANKTSVIANFANGLGDDARIWNNVQTASQIFVNNQAQLLGTEAGLQAYYKFNSAYTDATGNANNLTNVSTTFSTTDVPYPAPTTRLDIDQSATTGGNTYTLPTAISEAASDTLAFTPTKDPQKSVDFDINAKGTGNWTVTVHDQQNNIIATQTITNANLAAAGYQEFTFTTPWRTVVGKTYHMHLTSTVNDGSVVTQTAANFSTAQFHTYFGFLVTDTAFHPITPFLNFIAIGNERYVATWDGAFYQPNFITFPPGWRVRCFAFWREYLAIGVWKGTNIYDYPFGRVYFWDGISPTFNFFIDVGDGQVNAMFGMDSDLYMFVDYRGYLYNYQGGYFYNTGNTKSNKLKRVPKIVDTDYVEVYPGAFTMWRNLLHFGVAANSNSTTIQRGVYSWGSYNQNYQDTLSFDYPISTKNYGNTVTIGCVYPVGTQLIMGWQDGIAFGADVIDFNNPPVSNGTIELLVKDDDAIWKEKSQLTVRADHLQLRTGESISSKYQADRSGTWSTSPVNSTTTGANSKFTELNVDSSTNNGRSREYQIAVDLFATGSTSPTLLGISLLGDVLPEERQF